MGLFGTHPIAYTVGSAISNTDSRNLQIFFDKILHSPGGSEFTSELSVLSDGMHKFVMVRDKRGGPVVAYALLRLSYEPHGVGAEVEQLFATARGKGYGHLALHTAETVAKEHGARVLWLDSVPEASSFYACQGYATSDGVRFTKALKV